MPVVFRAHGMRFVIFVDDHPPPHVHVRGHGDIRIALDESCTVLTNKGMRASDIARARNAIRERLQELLDSWATIHGRSD